MHLITVEMMGCVCGWGEVKMHLITVEMMGCRGEVKVHLITVEMMGCVCVFGGGGRGGKGASNHC